MNASLDKLKEAHKNRNIMEIDSAMSELNDTWSKISTEMYSKQESTTPENTDESGVQDAQFEEVKE